jgi:hypothetical protein
MIVANEKARHYGHDVDMWVDIAGLVRAVR